MSTVCRLMMLSRFMDTALTAMKATLPAARGRTLASRTDEMLQDN